MEDLQSQFKKMQLKFEVKEIQKRNKLKNLAGKIIRSGITHRGARAALGVSF